MRFFHLAFAAFPLLAFSCQNRPTTQQETPPTTATPPTRVVADAALRETRWVPRQLVGLPVTVPADTREPYLLLRADGTAEGNGGCNRFRGTFFSETTGELKFSPLMSTRMACPAITLENDFTRALGQSSTYRISGDTLRLFSATNAPVARLEAVYLH